MRRVVVTGAFGGIGRATVRAFKAAGWTVIAVDRSDPPPSPEADEMIQLDLAEPGSSAAVARHVDGRGLDALVNNAAVSHDRPLAGTDETMLDEVLATNMHAPFHLIAGLQGDLARNQGAIVNVASVHAVATSRNVAAYAMSKGGLVALTRAVAVELSEDGIRCNAVLPGATQTAMLEEGFARRGPGGDPTAGRRRLVERTPLGRIGSPDEVAQAVLFFADGTRSSFVTGQSLAVDGGVLARLSSE